MARFKSQQKMKNKRTLLLLLLSSDFGPHIHRPVARPFLQLSIFSNCLLRTERERERETSGGVVSSCTAVTFSTGQIVPGAPSSSYMPSDLDRRVHPQLLFTRPFKVFPF